MPDHLFSDPTATVLLDEKGNLLGAKIADDGQWRFEPGDSVPRKFETCLLQFEDRRFYKHIGVSARGIGRSVIQNVKHKRIVSGGSTITMQLVRIMKKNPRRTIGEKVLEMLLATRVEIRYTKKDILSLYAAHAPFGNNVVGLEAASWRYFGRSPEKLSWAECATLAVLPNAPGLIYPGKNHKRLLDKRNRLLKRLKDIGVLDETSFQLALMEPLPEKPLPLPRHAPHLLMRLVKEGHIGQTIQSSIDLALQQKTKDMLDQHTLKMRENRIYNGAVLITSVKTGKVLAYIGNTDTEEKEHGSQVDCIMAPRSSGSILKPFLYANSMADGIINPHSLLLDVPTHFGSFAPANFSLEYDGAVTASQSLSRSLNVPFVRLLNEYGMEKFHYELKGLGITTLNKPAQHYGLSLILGGAETRLWDLNSAYASLAQSLRGTEIKGAGFITANIKRKAGRSIDKACIHAMFEAMSEVNRPDEDGNWKAFASSQKIAWKTGTSFGFRDAWAIGVTPDYVISVWIGNGDGEGRPGLTGIKAAAPLMFNLFSVVPKSQAWFSKPFRGIVKARICRESGYRAGNLCEQAELKDIPESCLRSPVCPYHQLVHLDKQGTHRVDMECETPENIKHVSWFVLPPGVEKYYKFNHPGYHTLPPYKKGCQSRYLERPMAILYPKPASKIYVPVEIDGRTGKTIFEATHRRHDLRIFWHLDDEYIGETRDIHQVALHPPAGKHKLMLLDEQGNSQEVRFEVIGRDRL